MEFGPQCSEFGELRQRTLDVLARAGKACTQIEAKALASDLQLELATLASDDFRILVIGDFNRGKSSLINAILAEEVLPVRNLACTGVVTRLRFGKERRAVLHPRDQSAPIKPIDVSNSWEPLRRYLMIDSPSNGMAGMKAKQESLYELAEIELPAEFLKSGIELVDTPGLNENPLRTAATQSWMKRIDAVMFVLACDQPMTDGEKNLITGDLGLRDHRDTFFVWNRFDAIEQSPGDIEDLKLHSKSLLDPMVARPTRIHFVSARQALSGRRGNDDVLLKRSGVPALEGTLREFLVAERGAAKLRTPIRVARIKLEAAIVEVLPNRESKIRAPFEDARAQLELSRPLLAQAEHQREKLLRIVDSATNAMTKDAVGSLRMLTATLDSGIAGRIADFPISTWDSIAKRGKSSDRMVQLIQDWITSEQEKWQRDTLTPMVTRHMRSLKSELDAESDVLFDKLDQLKAVFGLGVDPAGLAGGGNISGLERLLGAGLGVLGGLGSIMEGASLGVGSAAKGLAINVLTGVGMVLLGFSGPAIVAALAVLGIVRVMMGAKSVAETMREKVAGLVRESLRKSFPDWENQLGARLTELTADLRRRVDTRTRSQIDDAKSKLADLERKAAENEAKIKAKLGELGQIREEFKVLTQTIGEIEISLARNSGAVDAEHLAADLAEPIVERLTPHIREAVTSSVHNVGAAPPVSEGSLFGDDKHLFANACEYLKQNSELGFQAQQRDLLLRMFVRTADKLDGKAGQKVIYRCMFVLSLREGEFTQVPPTKFMDSLDRNAKRFRAVWDLVNDWEPLIDHDGQTKQPASLKRLFADACHNMRDSDGVQ